MEKWAHTWNVADSILNILKVHFNKLSHHILVDGQQIWEETMTRKIYYMSWIKLIIVTSANISMCVPSIVQTTCGIRKPVYSANAFISVECSNVVKGEV